MTIKKIIGRREESYLHAMHDYVNLVRGDLLQDQDKSEYLFNILRDIGYLTMMDFNIDSAFLYEAKKLYNTDMPIEYSDGSTFIIFEDITSKADRYKKLMQSMEPPPQYKGNLDEEETWEVIWRSMSDDGMELIFNGLDINATLFGESIALKGHKISQSWAKTWKLFAESAQKYLKKLYDMKELFYFLSDSVFSHQINFPSMPENDFRDFIRSITDIHESYAKENYYRRIFTQEEAQEIYYRISLKHENDPSTARVYFYKNELAALTIKEFILKTCFAKTGRNADTKKWSCLTDLDEDIYSVAPMLRAGDKEYLIYMLSPGVSVWGIRKDLVMLMPSEFQGALTCSWKEYPTGDILVRFDNYLVNKYFLELLESKQGDFVRLTFDEVYKEDKREEFLQMAANAVIGGYIKIKPESLPQRPSLPADIKDMMDRLPLRCLETSVETFKQWALLGRRVERTTKKEGDELEKFKVGDDIIYTVKGTFDGYLTVFHGDPLGNIKLIFPDPLEESNFVKKGSKDLTNIIATGPTGRHYFVAIWTVKQMVDLDKFNALDSKTKQEYFFEAIGNLKEEDGSKKIDEFEVMEK